MTAAETRTRLIEATAKLLDTTQPDQITTRAVLAASGISHGSLYHQFDDLQDLIDEALLTRLDAIVLADLQAVTPVLGAVTDRASAIQAVHTLHALRTTPEWVEARKQRAACMTRAMNRPKLAAAIRDHHQRSTDALSGVFAAWQEQGWIPAHLNPRAITVFAQAYQFGRWLDEVGGPTISDDDWLAVLNHMLDGFLTPET